MSTFQLRGGNGDEAHGRWTFVLCDGEHVNVVTGRMCDSRAEAVAHMEAVRAWPHTNLQLERHATQGAGMREGRHYFTLGETGFPTLATSNYFGTRHALELAILRFETYLRDATMLEDGESPPSPPRPRPHVLPPTRGHQNDAAASPQEQAAEYRVESTPAGHRATLRDDHRTLLATTPGPMRQAAVNAVTAIRASAAIFARYSGHVSATGWHWFRLHDAWGKVLATSGFFKTARSRNKAFGACQSRGPTAPFVEGRHATKAKAVHKEETVHALENDPSGVL